jgi:glucosamine kinase
MGFFLGIDGGGTKTRAVLGDETDVLASALSGGSNVVRLGEAQARESIHAVVRQVCDAAKVGLDRIDAICIGAAGAARPEIASKLRNIVIELVPQLAERILVVSDAAIALEAAFGRGPGVIAIAGTGSIVYGRDAAGHTARAGGWGFAISDEGSGHWIGRQAISSLLRTRDGGRETLLAGLILDTWHLDSIDALIQRANATPPPEFPRLFRVVVQASEKGDQIARELLARAGSELAALAAIVLQCVSPAPPYVPVATTGSVFRQSEEVRQVFYNQLQSRSPGLKVLEDFVEPVMGALELARGASRARTANSDSVWNQP